MKSLAQRNHYQRSKRLTITGTNRVNFGFP